MALYKFSQPTSVQCCHPEPFPFASLRASAHCAQGKLREGSGSMDREMLPLRFAQGFGSLAQHDMTGFWW